MSESEREGLRQCMLEPHPTKCVASEKNTALSSKVDAVEATASPKEVAKVEELPRRGDQQLTPELVDRLRKPKRRGTILLEELPPADVLFLEQPTPKKAAVFRKLLSENSASLAEPFAVCHNRAVESTPRKAAVFERLVARKAATSRNLTLKSNAVLEKPPPARKTTTFGRPPRKPLGPVKRLTSKMAAAIDAVRVEPAIPDEKMSVICVEAKVAVKHNEEEAINRNTGDVHSGPVAVKESRLPSEMSRGGSAPDGCGIANNPEILKQIVVNAEMARGDPRSAATSGWTTDERLYTTDRREERKEGEKNDADELEDGEIRDDTPAEASNNESLVSSPENYIYPPPSRGRAYLADPFQHDRTGDSQSTPNNSRVTYNTASSSSSSLTSTRISARAFSSSGSQGVGLLSRQFYVEMVDRLKNLQSFNSARPDISLHSSPSTGNSHPDDSRRREYTIWVEREVPKKKWSESSDVNCRRAPLIDYSDLFD